MIIRIDDNITIEVYFSVFNPEEGFDDDIRFAVRETGPTEHRIFAADETSFLLTPDQADQLATALQEAARDSRSTEGLL